MNILRLTLANLKRYIKTLPLMISLIILPFSLVLLVTVFTGLSGGSMYNPEIAIVCDFNSKYEKKLIKELDIDKNNVFDYSNKDLAISLLQNNDISAVFEIDKDFSSKLDNLLKPDITIYKTDNGGGSFYYESIIENFIVSNLKSNLFNDKNINFVTTNIINTKDDSFGKASMAILLVCYCLYINSASLCKDLLDLRSNNVLKRMTSTKNKDFEIIFSIFFALFLLQSLSCSIVLLALDILLKIDINLDMFLLVIANSFVSTGLVIALTRLFKNELSISITTIFYSLINMFLSLTLFLPNISSKIPFLDKIAKLVPLYWTFDVLIYNNVTIGLIALLLIGLVFVTAGSFKLKDFAKN